MGLNNKNITLEESVKDMIRKSLEEQAPIFALILATSAVSIAAILIRLSEAHAFTIAFWRLMIATVIMFTVGTLFGQTKEIKKLKPDRSLFLLFVSGFFLAIHFASWNLSLEYTSVAASVTIVDSSPLIVVFLSVLVLKENITTNQVIGIIIAVIGAVIIGLVDSSSGTETLYGDFLAFIGAVAVAVYLIIGRKSRSNLNTFSYVVIVYGSCAFFLFLGCLAINAPLLLSDKTEYLIFIVLAVFPSCLGHSLYNYSLGHYRAPIVSTGTLGEAVGSTILAIIFFNEFPGFFFLLGALILLFGVIITLEPWKGSSGGIE